MLIILVPLGALAPGTAWGEWSGNELKSLVGYVPGNFERLGALWKAALPDYMTPGVGNALLGYLFAAVIGVLLCAGIAWGLAAGLARRRKSATEPPHESPVVPPAS